MYKQKVKVPTPDEMWKRSKDILRTNYGFLSLDWNSPIPSAEDMEAIRVHEEELWRHPEEPITITDEFLSHSLDEQIEMLESRWQHKFESRPDVEIVPEERFLERVNELALKTGDALGEKVNLSQSPPTMSHSPYFGKILIPEKLPIRNLEHGMDITDFSRPVPLSYYQWGRDIFENVLNEELSHFLFRQIRGEIGEKFVTASKKMGKPVSHAVGAMNEMLAHMVKEQITANVKPKWGIYTVLNQINYVMQSRQHIEMYLGMVGFTRATSLKKAAVVDIFKYSNPSEVLYDFIETHPKNAEKQKIFYGR